MIRKKKVSFVDEFVNLVGQRLEEREMTVRELSDRAGVGFTHVYRILKGEHSPSMNIVEKIAHVLDLSVRVTK